MQTGFALFLILVSIAWLGYVYMEIKQDGRFLDWQMYLKAAWWALIPFGLGVALLV